jgi:hypothetical protein
MLGRVGNIKLAFVGQKTYFEACSMAEPSNGLAPEFVDFRSGADVGGMVAALERLKPDVVVVFRPEIIPQGAFASLDAVTLGYLTEPLPRTTKRRHPDLVRRLKDFEAVDQANFDRIVSFDPLIAETVSKTAAVWRSFPLPVADELYLPEESIFESRSGAVFTGRSTAHRESLLASPKHHHDVLHIAHGLFGDQLRETLFRSSVGINLHNEPYPTFENRVPTFMAAGLLVLTESLSPTHGLEPGLDYLEVSSADGINEILARTEEDSSAYSKVRRRGRIKSEQFRASAVYPRVINDLLLDVEAFGRGKGRG